MSIVINFIEVLSTLLQHPVNVQPIPLGGVTDKHMGYGTDDAAVLDDGAAGHE